MYIFFLYFILFIYTISFSFLKKFICFSFSAPTFVLNFGVSFSRGISHVSLPCWRRPSLDSTAVTALWILWPCPHSGGVESASSSPPSFIFMHGTGLQRFITQRIVCELCGEGSERLELSLKKKTTPALCSSHHLGVGWWFPCTFILSV